MFFQFTKNYKSVNFCRRNDKVTYNNLSEISFAIEKKIKKLGTKLRGGGRIRKFGTSDNR